MMSAVNRVQTLEFEFVNRLAETAVIRARTVNIEHIGLVGIQAVELHLCSFVVYKEVVACHRLLAEHTEHRRICGGSVAAVVVTIALESSGDGDVGTIVYRRTIAVGQRHGSGTGSDIK